MWRSRTTSAAMFATIVVTVAFPGVALAAPAVVDAVDAIPVAAPEPIDNFDGVPDRTSLTVEYAPAGILIGTANQHEARPGLSTVKLYVVDYALRHGDRSPEDLFLGERMIRSSDDTAATELDAKYPEAIDAVSDEYGMSETSRGSFWGDSFTSTADTVRFLVAKRADPLSPIPGWMATAAPTAADGTTQDWGTAKLPGVVGTKWGWGDPGSDVVASASFGPDFTIAANTYGTADEQTEDVLRAFGQGPDPLSPQDVLPPIPGLDQDSLEAFTDDLTQQLEDVLPG